MSRWRWQDAPPRPRCRQGCGRLVAVAGNQCRWCAHPRATPAPAPRRVVSADNRVVSAPPQCRLGCGRTVQKAGNRCPPCAVRTRKPRTKRPQQRRWPQGGTWAQRMRALYGS